jgi:aspartyl-tRNA(Asn)/glutamyl-tRNA(Gln) amidotransferase subunit C
VSLIREDIEKLCLLARLEITSSEILDVEEKLTDIVALVGELQAVDTDGVTPMAHPLDRSQRLRQDEVTETNDRERIQDGAPAVEQGLYLVPKVIE